MCYGVVIGGRERGGYGFMDGLIMVSIEREEGGGGGTGGKGRGRFEVGYGRALLCDNISIGCASNILC